MSVTKIPKPFTARITTDAKKLWSCSAMARGLDKNNKGTLPRNAGESIELLSPGETPSSFCNALRAWAVSPAYLRKHSDKAGYMVCEHQVDLDEEKSA